MPVERTDLPAQATTAQVARPLDDERPEVLATLSWSSPQPGRTTSAVSGRRYRIGELARYTGLTRQTLHNYTRWGLIEEAGWTPGGHRYYDDSVFDRLSRIMAVRRGRTIEQIKAILFKPAVETNPASTFDVKTHSAEA